MKVTNLLFKHIRYFRVAIIALSMLAGFDLNAQWVLENSGTSNPLLDVYFINSNTGWSCGEGGTILKTTNGGINWISQISGIDNKPLQGIYAVDSNFLYCTGWFETVLKSTNGGVNWTALRNGPVGTSKSYYGLYFLNQNTGWLLANHYVLKTTDGGNTFDSTYTLYSYLEDVYFRDNMNGVLCGDGSLIMKSTDGGVTWNQINIPIFNFGYPDFFKLSFRSNTGWIVARASATPGLGCLVYRTTNLGTTWDTIGRVPYPVAREAYCVYFSSINTGWTGGSYGYVYKTTNGGFNWIQENTPNLNIFFINALAFTNDSVGWGSGGGGGIIHTTTGGEPMGITQRGTEIPDKFTLYQNYPNPFNSQTVIEFDIVKKGNCTIEVFDLLGRKIETIFDGYRIAGKYKTVYNAQNLASGIYIYRISGEGFYISKKMILIK